MAEQPKSAWRVKRDRMARARGYRDYTDYRNHDNGRIPPGEPPIPRGQRSRVRGHRGETQLFRGFIREGDQLICDVRAVDRDKSGRYRLIEKQVLTPPQGRRRDRIFSLRDLTRDELAELIRFEIAKGVTYSPQPSLDQRRLISKAERGE